MNDELKRLRNHIEQVKKFAEKVEDTTITIEKMNPDYVYLIHTTSLTEAELNDVYQNGLAYSSNELWRTFHNLSQDWVGKSWAKEEVEKTSLEEVVVNTCKKMSFQCLLYRIPLSFFRKSQENYFPIPIWILDRTYRETLNPSSSGISPNKSRLNSTFFRLFPRLLFGHYDLRTNQFYFNSSYSTIFENSNGIYDSQQLSFLSLEPSYQDFWQHNQFILEGKRSPYTSVIDSITTFYQQKMLQEGKQK